MSEKYMYWVAETTTIEFIKNLRELTVHRVPCLRKAGSSIIWRSRGEYIKQFDGIILHEGQDITHDIMKFRRCDEDMVLIVFGGREIQKSEIYNYGR